MKKKIEISRKTIAAVLALILVLGGTIGGTIAWLVDRTEPVKNTFTYGDINISLEETTGDEYKILPGNDIEKDPEVTVKAGSEASWLFVKIEEVNWPAFAETDASRKVDYSVAGGWSTLTGKPGIYFREVDAVTLDTEFEVLSGDKVTVSENLNKTEVNAANSLNLMPELIFTAYAVQRDTNITTAADAWDIADTN